MKLLQKLIFFYDGKKYELRAQVAYRNRYLITLIEVEE